MTITLRSSLSRDLTASEVDANFTDLNTNKASLATLAASGGSALVGTIQSGTGAVTTETVQAALRRLVFSGQYDSTAHFNTATDALTGTVGLPPAIEQTHALDAGDYPWTSRTANTDVVNFNTAIGDFLNEGVRNTVLSIGYNAAYGGGARDASEPAHFLSFESRYRTGGDEYMEFHWQGVHTDGTIFRAFSWQINRSTKNTGMYVAVDKVQFLDRTGVNQAVIFNNITTTACAVIFNTGTSLQQEANNAAWLFQKNAAGLAYVEIARIGASNEVLIAPNAGLAKSGGNFQVGTNLLLSDGSAADPSLVFATDTKTGFAKANTGQIYFSDQGFGKAVFGGGNIRVDSAYAIGWCSGTVSATALETQLVRDAANTVALKNSTSAQEFRVYGSTTGPKYLSLKHDATNALVVPQTGQLAFQTAALATNATVGFMTIPSCAGTPSGTPASIPTGQVPWIYDSTNNIIYVYNGGWKKTVALT